MAEEMFPQHPRSGDWETLKGKMLAPHVQMPDEQAENYGDSRLNQSTVTTNWTTHTLVNTGMTRGGGTLAK